jgi:hypothetical protein
MTNPNRNAVDDFLFSTGIPGVFKKGDEFGKRVSGRVVNAEVKQATDIDGKPKFFDSGEPRMELVIDLQTDERDPAIEGDDGVRRIYASGGKYVAAEGTGVAMRDAIAKAMKDAGLTSLNETVKLTVAYSGLGVQDRAGYSQPRLYVAKAEKVSGGTVDVDDLLG